MSRKRQMIELSAPVVMREGRPEKFTVTGFACPCCSGNGWGWHRDPVDEHADTDGMVRKTCAVCGGTGEVDAEVTVVWKKQKGGL